MPEHDVENRAAVFGWPSCSKPLESITFVILDQPPPTSSRSVRRAYNMGSTVRSKKMAVSEPSGRLPAAMAIQLRTVIPGRAKREPGIHNHDREYGFRACASGRQLPTEGASSDVQLHTGG